jgi:hypothetical protein
MAKNEEMYITGPNSFKAYASQNSEEFSPASIPRGRAQAYQSRTFENWDTNVSVRSDYNRGDYEYFRPSYTVPQEQKNIISMCMAAYQKVGLVRNVIDLMGDFGSQGIRIQHPIKSTQDFYNNWFEKVGGPMVSERFMNLLYRAGQVVIKASYGKVTVTEERKMKKSKAAEEVKLPKTTVTKREIPLQYTFMDILSLEVLGQEVSAFVGQPALALRLTPKLKSTITALMADREKLTVEIQKMMDRIPKDVAEAIKKGQQYLPLDMDKTSVYYYKKDDWQLWADPLIASLLDDLLMLNKLKLADISALDGAISNIRLWTLGIIGDSPATSIMPTKAGINKLRSILSNNVGGGVLDLVYGPELKFTESNSQVWRFLGSEKYQVTLNNIYEGLGIPSSLRAGKGQSNTGNYVGLNTLVKRLQYGRAMLTDFWNKELKYIHKAMGFPGSPPKVVFDFMALADEAAEKKLLMDLWDRDIISDETIVELFGRLPDIEKARVKKEARDRANEVMPYKASPFHNPDKEHDYRKILLQLGTFAPSEIGIDLQDRKTDEQSHMEKIHEQEIEKMDKEMKNELKMQDKQNEFEAPFKQQETDNKIALQKDQQKFKQGLMKKQVQQKKTGTPGRPKNVTETKKRKSKPTERPSTKADFMNLVMWANSAQDQISEMVTKSILVGFGKATLRSLSNAEFDMYEKVKLDILCSLLPFEEITEEKVYNALANNQGINMAIAGSVKTLQAQFVLSRNRQPKVDELRQIYSTAYALVYEN